jgi:hypothetical protein
MVLDVFYFFLRWVILVEYIPVLRVLFPPVADNTFFSGYCNTCLHPAGNED